VARIYTIRTRYNQVSYLSLARALRVLEMSRTMGERYLTRQQDFFLTSTIGDPAECADYYEQ
jgi:hypothetical protein